MKPILTQLGVLGAVDRKVELTAKVSVFTVKLGVLNLANYKSVSQ